jgi:hypothetical protein
MAGFYRILVAQALLPVRFSSPSRTIHAINDSQNRTGKSACATKTARLISSVNRNFAG